MIFLRPIFKFVAVVILLFTLFACRRQHPIAGYHKPQRTLTSYFDSDLLLYRLDDAYYLNKLLEKSFTKAADKSGAFMLSCGATARFEPLGYPDSLCLQYTHIYSPKCVYHTTDSIWKFAEVAFPNTCLTNHPAYAKVVLKNTSDAKKKYFLRLFYQNTSYWYNPADNLDNANSLDNYYGYSQTVSVELEKGQESTLKIPYTIGTDPKYEELWAHWKVPARAGNYEFMLLVKTDSTEPFFSPQYDLKKGNPFTEVKRDELKNNGANYLNNICYVDPHHFKFVFLDEYFDGVNDLAPRHVYVPKNNEQKRLCDTCNNYFPNLISENWTLMDFFKGYLSKTPKVKAEYGNRLENYTADANGITLKIPRSTPDKKLKTWAEFIFGQTFKYGHLTIHAKFAQMLNPMTTPNGIIHNLWLYQLDPDKVDTTNPYSYLRDPNGAQKFEIDYEFWTATNEKQAWDNDFFINYSVVDYMRDAKVKLKPGKQKRFGNYLADRFNNRQMNIPGESINRNFLNDFHTYELIWKPNEIVFMMDKEEKARITPEMAKIPDRHLFLWIGSPIYQDGTFYNQGGIPFLQNDKYTIIDYIKIE